MEDLRIEPQRLREECLFDVKVDEMMCAYDCTLASASSLVFFATQLSKIARFKQHFLG